MLCIYLLLGERVHVCPNWIIEMTFRRICSIPAQSWRKCEIIAFERIFSMLCQVRKSILTSLNAASSPATSQVLRGGGFWGAVATAREPFLFALDTPLPYPGQAPASRGVLRANSTIVRIIFDMRYFSYASILLIVGMSVCLWDEKPQKEVSLVRLTQWWIPNSISRHNKFTVVRTYVMRNVFIVYE